MQEANGTCQQIVEAVINCYDESLNNTCAKKLPVNGLIINRLGLKYSKHEFHSNETCYNRYFDQYSNQDGKCSFQDVQE